MYQKCAGLEMKHYYHTLNKTQTIKGFIKQEVAFWSNVKLRKLTIYIMVGIGKGPFFRWFPQYSELYKKSNTHVMLNVQDQFFCKFIQDNRYSNILNNIENVK